MSKEELKSLKRVYIHLGRRNRGASLDWDDVEYLAEGLGDALKQLSAYVGGRGIPSFGYPLTFKVKNTGELLRFQEVDGKWKALDFEIPF